MACFINLKVLYLGYKLLRNIREGSRHNNTNQSDTLLNYFKTKIVSLNNEILLYIIRNKE
jgi:hypothetical protein